MEGTGSSDPNPPVPCAKCHVDKNLYAGLTETETKNLPPKAKVPVRSGDKIVEKVASVEYAAMPSCPANNDPDGDEVWCDSSQNACKGVKNAEGPLSRIFMRATKPKTPPQPWKLTKMLTCWPTEIPGGKPKLTVAMINSEFVKTPFARPQVKMEPVGNRTLANLPNFFMADFSGKGYGPGEVRDLTLLGHSVRVRPTLKSNTFHFGDGSSLGPTESRGGGYPDGDIKHAYLKRGTVSASVTTVYGGQFAVDGGEFTDLPGTATITGPAQPIQVLEAKGRLVR